MWVIVVLLAPEGPTTASIWPHSATNPMSSSTCPLSRVSARGTFSSEDSEISSAVGQGNWTSIHPGGAGCQVDRVLLLRDGWRQVEDHEDRVEAYQSGHLVDACVGEPL